MSGHSPFNQYDVPLPKYVYTMNQHVNTSAIPTFSNINYTTNYKTLHISSMATKTTGNTSPDFIKVKDNGAGSTGIYMTSFPNGKTCDIFFQTLIPNDYKEGTDIVFKVPCGCSTFTTGTFIHLQAEWSWDNEDVVVPATSTVSDNQYPCPPSGTYTLQTLGTFNGSGKKRNSIITARFSRVNDGQDTYGGELRLTSLLFIYQSDNAGSFTY